MLSPDWSDNFKVFHGMTKTRFTIWLKQLVEDMVRPLNFLLLSDTGLLKKVGHNVTTTELARGGEVDTDELSEPINEQCQSCWEISNI